MEEKTCDPENFVELTIVAVPHTEGDLTMLWFYLFARILNVVMINAGSFLHTGKIN